METITLAEHVSDFASARAILLAALKQAPLPDWGKTCTDGQPPKLRLRPPASPVFTRVSGLSIRKHLFTWVSGWPVFNSLIYGHFRSIYLQPHCFLVFPGDLSASPLFTWASSMHAGKRPIDKGCRSNRAGMPKRRGV